jgi:hypothetical protein
MLPLIKVLRDTSAKQHLKTRPDDDGFGGRKISSQSVLIKTKMAEEIYHSPLPGQLSGKRASKKAKRRSPYKQISNEMLDLQSKILKRTGSKSSRFLRTERSSPSPSMSKTPQVKLKRPHKDADFRRNEAAATVIFTQADESSISPVRTRYGQHSSGPEQHQTYVPLDSKRVQRVPSKLKAVLMNIEKGSHTNLQHPSEKTLPKHKSKEREISKQRSSGETIPKTKHNSGVNLSLGKLNHESSLTNFFVMTIRNLNSVIKTLELKQQVQQEKMKHLTVASQENEERMNQLRERLNQYQLAHPDVDLTTKSKLNGNALDQMYDKIHELEEQNIALESLARSLMLEKAQKLSKIQDQPSKRASTSMTSKLTNKGAEPRPRNTKGTIRPRKGLGSGGNSQTENDQTISFRYI